MRALIRRRSTVIVALLAGLLVLTSPTAAGAQLPPDTDAAVAAHRSTLAIAWLLVDGVLNDGDADVAALIVAPDATITTHVGTFTGPDGLLAYAELVRAAYPGATFAVAEVRPDGDTIAIGWVLQTGPESLDTFGRPVWATSPPTGVATIVVRGDAITAVSTGGSALTLVEGPTGIAALPPEIDPRGGPA